MKLTSQIPILFSVLILAFSCNQKQNDSDTILAGKATIYVDETILPIIEEQIAVFESDYDAKITLIAKPEAQIVKAIANDSASIVILTRRLSDAETRVFEQRKIAPKTEKIGTDAIVLIANKKNKDTVISVSDVIGFLKGDRDNAAIKGLVFDNPNSSTVRYLKELAGISVEPKDGVFSFATNEEVIKFVSENQNMIGIVGLNWLSTPSETVQKLRSNINIISVKKSDSDLAYYPSQDNLAQGKYPLARDLYIVAAQGYSGLGVGVASFISGERGQRIILKSGLLPVRIPGRKIVPTK